jgi:hypothetical protein
LRAVQVPASPGSTPARITRCCKPLGAIGDGGMAVTFDAALADRLRRLRQYGWDEERVTHETGWRKWRPCSLPACRDARSTMDERDSVIHHKTGDVSDKNSCENSGAPSGNEQRVRIRSDFCARFNAKRQHLFFQSDPAQSVSDVLQRSDYGRKKGLRTVQEASDPPDRSCQEGRQMGRSKRNERSIKQRARI